ncbi:hypothetical protein R1sor_020463 [Riccia sorocarpa]|uniref:Uncharacterized protein n=1 Tax=Riccia sorocarpa TaxID=122646 RepID=A0ABD3IG69_9MARC
MNIEIDEYGSLDHLVSTPTTITSVGPRRTQSRPQAEPLAAATVQDKPLVPVPARKEATKGVRGSNAQGKDKVRRNSSGQGPASKQPNPAIVGKALAEKRKRRNASRVAKGNPIVGKALAEKRKRRNASRVAKGNPIVAERAETSILQSDSERRAKLVELVRQYYQFYDTREQTAKDISLLNSVERQVPSPKKRKTSNKTKKTAQNVLPLTTTFEIKNKTQEEEELDEVWADFEFVSKQTQAAVKAKLSAPSPSVALAAAEDPLPWTRMSKQEMLAHYRGLKRIKYERRFYEFLRDHSSFDRDNEWKKLRQLKEDPKLYHLLVAIVQHMVERHGAKEPQYCEHWWPPIIYDPEAQKPKPGTEAETEEDKLFKIKHPRIYADWVKDFAEREKKRKIEDEAELNRMEKRRIERKAQAERIEEREDKRKKAQAEAIESIKRRYQNGSLVRDVGLEPRCRHEVQWNHCSQCRVYGRTPFLEWNDDDLCERADLIERREQAKKTEQGI